MSEKKIQVICPVCNANSFIPVPTDIISQKASGATSILIPPHTICPHTFHVYVDKNLTVRDYLVSDLTLIEQKDSYEMKKKEIMGKLDSINLDLDNVLQYISEKDLKALLFAGFIDSPLIFVEADLENPRFEVVFGFMCKVVGDFGKLVVVMSPEKFIDFESKFQKELKKYTIFDSSTTPPIRKPFSTEETEAFQEVLKILRTGNPKIARVMAKNHIDYLKKISAEVQSMAGEKDDKILKKLKKNYPNQENLFTPAMLSLMRKRNDFLLELAKTMNERLGRLM